MSRRGHDRERAIKRCLEEEGWIVLRAPGSLGLFDLVALKAGHMTRLIECKSTAGGPFEHFGPADRAALVDVAEKAGAVPELAWWPPRGRLRFLTPGDWPR